MADFYGALLSTSFRVKDRAAWLADPDVQTLQKYVAKQDGGFFEEHEGYWAFGWYGQYPSWILVDENDDAEDPDSLNLTDVIERHILPGDVCKMAISGNEKLRYIGGPLCWVTWRTTVYFNAETAWPERLTEEDIPTLPGWPH